MDLPHPVVASLTHRRRWHLIGWAILSALLLWLCLPGVASAHAHLVQADPAPGAVISRAPAVATFIFDEPLNAALTRVRITDASGHPVTTDPGHLGSGHGGELWQLPLPKLRPGTYSVYWTSESAIDGHVMSSFYTFQVAASGGASGLGAVSGASAGAYGGTGGLLTLSGGAIATGLFVWLGLLAQTIWLGALVIELFVLAPARGTAKASQASLAQAATPRLWWMVRGGLVVALWALIAEVVSLAVQGTGGDWGRALAPDTLGGVLSSQNGHFLVIRLVTLLVALLLAGQAGVARLSLPAERLRTPRHALGIAAPAIGLLAMPWQTRRITLALLAALYMLLVALSGHAADVTPAWLSVPIDWLHLLFTAAWVGGIAALAYGALPARRTLPVEERAPAVVSLLDRFSPVAYLAVGTLALSGLYNALNHLASPDVLFSTAYGQLLIVKLACVATLIGLSASHVFLLRPQLTALSRTLVREVRAAAQGPVQDRGGYSATIAAALETGSTVHEGLATLAARLRLEAGAGAAVLLATAMMGQTLPPSAAATASGPATGAVTTVPASISGLATTGDLRAALTVAPPAVGTATFTLQLWEKGTLLNADNAAALIHLYPAVQPALRANLTTTAQGSRFTVRGSLAAAGTWRADVLVRTATVNEWRTLPFTFRVGPGAAFMVPAGNAAAVTIAVTPGRIAAPNTFTITGVQAPAVRLLSESLDMNMGVLPYLAAKVGPTTWRVSGVYAPMNGRWGLTVQEQSNGAWVSVRQFVYNVPLSGAMRLLTPRGGTATTTRGAAPRTSNLGAALNVAFARRLPYTVFVTEMGSNGVRQLNGPLLHTGVQAHGVDGIDGAPYILVTNFGAEPGTVSEIDIRTMRVIRTFKVGLGPAHIAFSPDHSRAYVTNFRSSDLSVIDMATGRTQTVTFPDQGCFEPHGIDISEDGRTLYVACGGGAWIYTLDARTLKPGKAVITAPGAFGVAVDAPRREVWVTNQTSNSVSVVSQDTLKVVATIAVGKGPALLVASPDGRTIYVADQLGNTVSVIDAASRRVRATIPVASQPHGPDVTPDGRYLYVASIGGNAVTIIRTSDNRVVAVVPSANGSNEVAVKR